MRGHDSGRAHVITAPAYVAALSRLRRCDGAYSSDPAGRISLRTTHLRVPGVQRCRYPGSPRKLVAAAARFFRRLLARTAARSPARQAADSAREHAARARRDLPFPVGAKRQAMADTHGRWDAA